MVFVFLVFKSPPVQSFITSIIAKKLSDELKATISIGSVDITFFKDALLHDVYVSDQKGDTLFFIKHLLVSYKNFDTKTKFLHLKKVEIYQPIAHLKLNEKGFLNLQYILDYFSGDTLDTTPSASVKIHVDKFKLINGLFSFDDIRVPFDTISTVNFGHLLVSNIIINASNINIFKNQFVFNIHHLSLKERSGLFLRRLSSSVKINDNGIWMNKLAIETNNSIIRTLYFNLKTNTLDDFNDFVNNVRFDVKFYLTRINFGDIAYFARDLKGINHSVIIAGDVKGSISMLRTSDFIIAFKNKTLLKGNYEITGLPDINNTYFHLKFKELKTYLKDINNLQILESEKNSTVVLPEWLVALGNVYYKGEISGFLYDFVAYGTLKSNAGIVKADAKLVIDTLNKTTSLIGKVITENFDVGKVLKTSLLKTVSLTATTKTVFKRQGFNSTIKTFISQLDFNNYNYKDIKVEGDVNEKMFDGVININDPNLTLDFLGKIDYSKKLPVFNFMAEVKKAQLNKLNLVNKDSNIVLSFMLDSKIEGDKLSNINGNIDLYQVKYVHGKLDYYLPNLKFSIYQQKEEKSIKLLSNDIDLAVDGNYEIDKLPEYFLYLFEKHFIGERNTINFNIPSTLSINVNQKKYIPVIQEWVPQLYVSNKLEIKYSQQNEENVLLNVYADSIKYENIHFNNINLSLKTEEGKVTTSIHGKTFLLSSNFVFSQPQIDIYTQNQKNEIYLKWQQSDSIIGDGDISMILKINKDKNYNISGSFNPSMFNLNNLLWYINDGEFYLKDSLIIVDNIILNQSNQYFRINGVAGTSLNDSIIIQTSNLQLNLINPLIQSTGFEIDGIVNGLFTFKKLLNNPIISTNTTIDSLYLNGEELGNLSLNAEWNNEQQRLYYVAKAFRGKINTFELKGTSDINGNLDAKIKFEKWRMNVLEPFASSFASDIRGNINGELSIKGKISSPQIYGNLSLIKASFKIPFLNTRYNFTGDVIVNPTSFNISSIDVYDEDGNKAVFTGSITHHNFSDIYLDFQLKTNRFLAMNTTLTNNSMFYGSIYTSGLVFIKGNPESINISADVQTEKGTIFNLNLESQSEITQQNFIRFVNKSENQNFVVQDNINSSGINLNFNIQATPDANIQLIFDSKVGDIIRSKGTGNIRMELKSNGDFVMYGNYVISEGDYLFTLQNIINKRFEIVPGSIIRFNGDPLNADIDIQANYKLRTSLMELMLDSSYKNRVQVNCFLNLKNKLTTPQFNFKIEIPNADSRVEGVLSSMTEEEINKQVISLMVLNKFVTPENFKSGLKTVEYSNVNVVGVNTSEMLTNQLNHWLSQISKTVNLGVNYRPGDVLTNEELALALNTQILNDRVTINTNIGVSNSNTTESSMMIGDFDLEVKLNKSGKLKAKGFNRTNTSLLKDTSPYTQGVGLFYKEDFDSWNELWKNYWNAIFSKRKEEQ